MPRIELYTKSKGNIQKTRNHKNYIYMYVCVYIYILKKHDLVWCLLKVEGWRDGIGEDQYN